ncbi:hypothetical protein DFH08DRAFT_957653 [Mycena albidolilacea]|uniref:Uncharacterized protein n=1 Tax=Mycena albidolilacea TaxID=1033008 RepID=A0AAD7ETQ2_9AGAR|nr:hypothetical protein DFH08DRAFT_957653 [Mycena albidolilacea]
MSPSSPIPTALVAPIIEAYAEGIRPAFAFILILTIFGTLFMPLLFLLLALSTPQLRRKPTFILNVVSVSIGIVSSALGTHITIRDILSPFTNFNLTEDRIYSCLEIWKGWGAEAVLLLRIATVFPRSRLPLLLVFPITLKVARAGFNIAFSVKWVQLLAETRSEYSVLPSLPTYILKAILVLELVDNRQGWANGFQVIFLLAELIAVFDGRAATLIASLHEVNMCIVIICTVFATVWSSTTSFTEAISKGNTIISLDTVIFRVERTMDTTSAPLPDEAGESSKSASWGEMI